MSPTSINFGTVATGVANTQMVQISNPSSSTTSVTISAATIAGAGFSTSGMSLPLTLQAGQNTSFSVQFDPKAAGAVSGSLALVSTATTPSSGVALSGTGVAAALTLSANPSSVSFGNVTVGNTASRSITVTNSGNSTVAISSVGISGAGLMLSGGSAVSLSPSQSITLTVQYAPTGAAATTGQVSIVSNATGSPNAINVSGTGVAQVQHTVNLGWNASTSATGYNVYRSVTSGGGYSRINAAQDGNVSYSDNTVQNTLTYFYVTTSVDSSGLESAYSSEVSVTIP
jgi:Abnormal spindle-like microcephaly-assoc'd, ASPM-SPD-2-Hydin